MCKQEDGDENHCEEFKSQQQSSGFGVVIQMQALRSSKLNLLVSGRSTKKSETLSTLLITGTDICAAFLTSTKTK